MRLYYDLHKPVTVHPYSRHSANILKCKSLGSTTNNKSPVTVSFVEEAAECDRIYDEMYPLKLLQSTMSESYKLSLLHH